MTIKIAGDILSATAVRHAAHRMLDDGLAGRLDHWIIDLDRMPEVARFVAAVTRENYPSLAVPLHARWRHFEAGGLDRWKRAQEAFKWPDAAARARAAFDLAIVSVLLDAGSGGVWRYTEPDTGMTFASSEGLAIASFGLVAAGTLSADPADPWRADAERLIAFTEAELCEAFQVNEDNPLAGVRGRVSLLNRLGRICKDRPDLFGRNDQPRPGGLADALAGRAINGGIEAAEILKLVLNALASIWPGRLAIGGVELGDSWRYPRWERAGDPLSGIVPFHKLSQWMTYSLIEPLQELGLTVTSLDCLTGLAEYRNGGLFMDMGVLKLKVPSAASAVHQPSSPLVIEWRALTVALIDRLLPLVRDELDIASERFPLACLLQGGTWTAGRRIAREKRKDGRPPLNIDTDGTVF